MTVYVDYLREYPKRMINGQARKHGRSWSHLFSDNIEELHLFAKGIGLRKIYFQDKPTFPHYDITPNKRNIAILRGAKPIQLIDFLRNYRKIRTKQICIGIGCSGLSKELCVNNPGNCQIVNKFKIGI